MYSRIIVQSDVTHMKLWHFSLLGIETVLFQNPVNNVLCILDAAGLVLHVAVSETMRLPSPPSKEVDDRKTMRLVVCKGDRIPNDDGPPIDDDRLSGPQHRIVKKVLLKASHGQFSGLFIDGKDRVMANHEDTVNAVLHSSPESFELSKSTLVTVAQRSVSATDIESESGSAGQALIACCLHGNAFLFICYHSTLIRW